MWCLSISGIHPLVLFCYCYVSSHHGIDLYLPVFTRITIMNYASRALELGHALTCMRAHFTEDHIMLCTSVFPDALCCNKLHAAMGLLTET